MPLSRQQIVLSRSCYESHLCSISLQDRKHCLPCNSSSKIVFDQCLQISMHAIIGQKLDMLELDMLESADRRYVRLHASRTKATGIRISRTNINDLLEESAKGSGESVVRTKVPILLPAVDETHRKTTSVRNVFSAPRYQDVKEDTLGQGFKQHGIESIDRGSCQAQVS